AHGKDGAHRPRQGPRADVRRRVGGRIARRQTDQCSCGARRHHGAPSEGGYLAERWLDFTRGPPRSCSARFGHVRPLWQGGRSSEPLLSVPSRSAGGERQQDARGSMVRQWVFLPADVKRSEFDLTSISATMARESDVRSLLIAVYGLKRPFVQRVD